MKFSYFNTDIRNIDNIQNEALKIYGKYDLEKSMLWMTEEFGEFFKAIRKDCTKEEITGEMGDLLAWILCMGNILDIRLSDAIENTFKKEIQRQLTQYSTLKYCDGLADLNIVEDNSNAGIRIGLPKGNVIGKSLQLVRYIMGEDADSKKLSFKKDNITLLLLKHRDIPKMIEKGQLDVGITSYEWIVENDSKVKVIKELDWCDTRIALIGGAQNEIDNRNSVNCLTEFPNIAKEYFVKKNMCANVTYISGSSEACVPEMADCCVDCVETARTLRHNNLEIKDVILESKMMLITNQNFVDSNNVLPFIVDKIKGLNHE